MRPDTRFLAQPKDFWAYVRSISEQLGYTHRSTKGIRVFSYGEMSKALESLGLQDNRLLDTTGEPTTMGQLLHDYFQFRADQLNNHVRPRLMDLGRAVKTFDQLSAHLKPKRSLTYNKQRGEKKKPAYLTAIVNMVIEDRLSDLPCDFDPRQLTTFTRDRRPLRTLARRVDGAFPSIVSPIAIWEIKEYYYTTTFGSRVADGVYETLLDGLELEELREHEGIDCKHYLIVDAYVTWWEMGRSYLCRMVDMMHMGYVDEVLFGYEVVEELPRIVDEWIALYWRGRPS